MTDPFAPGRGDGTNAPAYAEEDSTANAYASSGKRRTRSEREAYAAVYSKAPVAARLVGRWNAWAAVFGGSETTPEVTPVPRRTQTLVVGGATAYF